MLGRVSQTCQRVPEHLATLRFGRPRHANGCECGFRSTQPISQQFSALLPVCLRLTDKIKKMLGKREIKVAQAEAAVCIAKAAD